MFAEGFSYQNGATFGCGPLDNLDTEKALKIYNADAVTLQKLHKFVQVHNILEERNVREANCELIV